VINLCVIGERRPNTVEEEESMVRTVVLGSCVSVQGMFVRQLACGRILVRVGQRLYAGLPVGGRAA